MTEKKEKIKLQAEIRKVIGRKVKTLRKAGILPTNVYGKKIKSQSLQVNLKDFDKVLAAAGETGLVDLEIKGEEKTRPVLLHNIQRHPVSGDFLHVDFYQVDLKEKVTTSVSVELIGESLAVKDKLGILIQPLSEVEIEALPTDLPDKLEIDINGLKAIDDAVTVADLKVPAEIKVLTDASQILAKIEPLAKEEIAPVPTVEEAPAEGAPATEGEQPAEGEKPAEEEKSKGEASPS